MIKLLRSVDYKPLLKFFGMSVAFTALLETIARRSFAAFLIYAFTGFVPFIYNSLLVCLTMYPAVFFKRRRGVLTLICALWLTLVTISSILHTMRPSPLTAADFGIFFSSLEIMDSYLSRFEIVLMVIAIWAIVAAVLHSFAKSKIQTPSYRASGIRLCVAVLAFGLFTLVGRVSGLLNIDFSIISDAYDDYGFAYCFASTIFKNGIDKPKNYDKENVEWVIENLPEVSETAGDDLPNIVFVQLESFFDINYYKDYEAVENPVPYFTELKKKYPSGKFDVPVFGGGTANTEFEVLTGMRVGNFSGGEIPYNTVLEEKTCESLPNILKNYGYKSFAIHNHTGTFYDRYKVYANLGFDVFTPSEYMTGITYTPVGWERDSILTRYIFDALESTAGHDFVFAVSVQGHGGYPTYDEKNNFDLPLTLKNDDGSAQAYSVRYFANQLREMDDFIGELVAKVESFDEKTVVVFYGDHLPALKLESNNLDYITTYQTEYVVYSNFDFDFDTGNANTQIRSNQIGSEVLRALSINDGLITRVNQARHELKDYSSVLKLLQYDMLYGENYSSCVEKNGSRIYPAANIKLGTNDIVITDAVYDGSRFRVNCDNSTYYSVIFINGEMCDTKYISESILVCDTLETLNSKDEITIHQISDSGVDLGSSAPHIMD